MSKSVLFVDDNEDLRRLMTVTLAPRGRRVVAAENDLTRLGEIVASK